MWFFLFSFSSSFLVIALIFLRIQCSVMREEYRKKHGNEPVSHQITIRVAAKNIAENKQLFLFLGVIVVTSLLYSAIMYAFLKHGLAYI